MGGVTSTIANRFAFFPPTPPTYKLVKDAATGRVSSAEIPARPTVELRCLQTSRRQEIVAVWVANHRAKLTVLYSHGNAVDLGQMHDLFVALSSRLGVNILGYDYSGYGASTGTPSELNTYSDIRAAYDSLRNDHNVRSEDIVLYGQSVGSGPTVDLAAKLALKGQQLRGVVLHCPILSGVRVLYEVKRTYWFDIYKNVEKIGQITCPVLVMHGTADEVVDVMHGRQLHELCKHPYEPLWIEGGHHCDLECFPAFLNHLQQYIRHLEQRTPPLRAATP
eukprot:SM000003S10997  [mRNA]  locus=s3:232134:233963:+ [translate_table: standard]